MKTKHFLALVAIAALGGCYDYPDPPVATLGNSYTQREHDDADEIFKDLSALSLADAQRIALHNNPTYAAAHHAVSAAHMRYLQSFAGYMPQITAGFGMSGGDSWIGSTHGDGDYSLKHPRTDTLDMGVNVSATMLLFDGLIREFQVMEASHSEKYYSNMDADACRTMMLSVAKAYNSVLLAIENRRIAEEDRKFQVTSLRDTRYKFEAGAVPLSDVLNFEIQMHNAEVGVINAEYQYESAVYALALLMGYPDGTLPKDVALSGHIKTRFIDLPAVEIYLDAALANRPDLKGYREQLEIAKYQLYQQYGSFSPTASAYFKWGYDINSTFKNDTESSAVFYGHSQNSRSYKEGSSIGYGINVDWVIFSGFKRYNKMREYQANLAIADYKAAAQWFQVINDVRTAYASYSQSVRKTKMLEKVRDLSAKQRDLVDDEYRAGNTELTRLNEAQRNYVDAEANLASSYVNIQDARASLDAAVGVNDAEFYENQSSAELNNVPSAAAVNPPADDNDTAQPAPVKSGTSAPPSDAAPEVSAAATPASASSTAPESAPVTESAPGSSSPDALPEVSAAATSASAVPAAPAATPAKPRAPVIPASATALP